MAITWLFALFTTCSRFPLKQSAVGLCILPALSWQSSLQTSELESINSDFPENDGSLQLGQGSKVKASAGHYTLSSALNDVAGVSNRHDDSEVLLTLPHIDVLSYLDTSALSSGTEGIAHSSLSTLKDASTEPSAVLSSSKEPSTVSIRAGELLDPLTGEMPTPSELSIHLDSAPFVGHSRHRPAPGLPPAEKKLSSRRNGVPQLEMLGSRSKPRKGVPQPPEPLVAAPAAAGKKQNTRRTGVPDLEMLKNPSKPRKGVSPPPSTLSGADGTLSAAGPELGPAGNPTPALGLARQEAAAANLAKARASAIVGVTFGLLSLLVLAWYGVRRAADRWHHRHYRKLDFLVDGMDM